MSGLLNILAPMNVVLRAMRNMPGCEISSLDHGNYQAWFGKERAAVFGPADPDVGVDFSIQDRTDTIDGMIYDYLGQSVGAPMFLTDDGDARVRVTADYPSPLLAAGVVTG